MFNQLIVWKMRTQLFLSEVNFDFLSEPIPEGEDILGDVTEKAKNVGKSAVNFVQVLSVISLFISIMCLGISLFMFKNGQKRAENKEHIPYILLGGVLVFGALGFMGLIQSIAQGI